MLSIVEAFIGFFSRIDKYHLHSSVGCGRSTRGIGGSREVKLIRQAMQPYVADT